MRHVVGVDTFPIAGQREVSIVDVRDVAKATVNLMETGGRANPVPMLGHNIAINGLFEEVGKLVSIEEPLAVNVPDSMMSVGASVLEAAGKSLNLSVPSALTVLLMTEDVADCPRGSVLPVTPLETTLLDSIAWYRSLGYC